VTAAKLHLSLLVGLCLPSLGCGLVPIPYASNVTGPVRGVRVLDLGSGTDILDASATVDTGLGMTDLHGAAPPQLLVWTSEPPREKPAGRELTRRKDQAFEVPKCVMLGVAAHGDTHNNPPTATIAVSAPGYVRATLEYCVEEPPQPDWSETRSVPQEWTVPQGEATPSPIDPKNAEGNAELVRCEFHEDGIVHFFLRRAGPSEAASSKP
jgi:hypothetical protein